MFISKFSLITSLPEQSEIKKIKVFPSPFQDYINLEGLNNEDAYTLALYDPLGRIVTSATTKGKTTFNLNNIHSTAGVYSLILISNKGESVNRTLVKIN